MTIIIVTTHQIAAPSSVEQERRTHTVNLEYYSRRVRQDAGDQTPDHKGRGYLHVRGQQRSGRRAVLLHHA